MWCLTPLAPIMGLCLPFHHREFLRLITPQHGCYRPIALTICKHTNEPGCGIRTHVRPVAPAVLLRYRLMCLHIETTYKNTFDFSSMLAQRTFRHCQVTETVTAICCAALAPSKMFIYMVQTNARGFEPRPASTFAAY